MYKAAWGKNVLQGNLLSGLPDVLQMSTFPDVRLTRCPACRMSSLPDVYSNIHDEKKVISERFENMFYSVYLEFTAEF